MLKPVSQSADPNTALKSLRDKYDKENRLRNNWYLENKDSIKKRILNREPKHYTESDIAAYVMAQEININKQDNIIYRENRLRDLKMPIDAIPKGIESLKQGHSIVNLGLGDPKEDPILDRPDTDLTLDPIMRPVDPKLKKVMYDSKDVFGRENYLKKRSDIQPENRYYFPECVNWDYGWRLKDGAKVESVKFGRIAQITQHADRIEHKEKEKRDAFHYRTTRRQSVFTKVNAGKWA